jgi:4-hydroxy-3-methylbut-2-enyl diphosphate reductase IspH
MFRIRLANSLQRSAPGVACLFAPCFARSSTFHAPLAFPEDFAFSSERQAATTALPQTTMAKIDVAKVADILRKNHLEPAVMRRILEQISHATEEAAAAGEEKPPAVKKQFVVLISDPDGALPSTDFAAWVLQLPEEASALSTQERIEKAAFDFNASRSGRALAVISVVESFDIVS